VTQMMDPGTALGVASLAYEVTKDLYDYYRTWKDCEKDVGDMREQLIWLNHAFKATRDIVRKAEVSTQRVDLLYTALEACKDSANDLQDILKKISKQETPKSAWDQLKAHGRKACYAFRKPTVTSIKANLDALCDELGMALSLLQLETATNMQAALREVDSKLVNGFDSLENALQQLPSIFDTVSALVNRTTEMKLDTTTILHLQQSQRAKESSQELMNWFCTTDYSQQQNDYHVSRISILPSMETGHDSTNTGLPRTTRRWENNHGSDGHP
jgi:hypothetical protein